MMSGKGRNLVVKDDVEERAVHGVMCRISKRFELINQMDCHSDIIDIRDA